MLIDDNKIDNFFHERVIRKSNAADKVIPKQSAQEALDHLASAGDTEQPDLIFLDINMPGMNGWEFLEHYKRGHKGHKAMVVVMLSSAERPDEQALEKTAGILSDFRSKPITSEMLEELTAKYCAATEH